MNSLRKMGLKSWIYLIPEFGYILPIRLGFLSLVRLICPSRMINSTFERKHALIEKYLLNKGILSEPLSQDANNSVNISKNIWVFWWQGVDAMPDIVKTCYNRLCSINTKYNVILVTRDNFKEYARIPEYITSRIGIEITITHFSDILRANLLYTHGGIWVDATLYFIRPIPASVFEQDFFSIKDRIISSMSPARHRWTGFFLCAKQGLDYMRLFKDCFERYWKSHHSLIDYLLIDYYLDIIYNNNSAFKTTVDFMEYSDYNVHCMEKVASSFDESFCKEIQEKNLFIKMSYKGYDESSLLNTNTNYRHLVMSCL